VNTQKSNNKSNDGFFTKKVEPIRNLVIKLTFGSIGLGFLLSEFARIKNLPFNIEGYSYLVLLACLGITIASWYWGSENDLKTFDAWLHPDTWIPPTAFKEKIMATGVGLMIITLMIAARNPFLYGMCLFVYNIYDILVTKYVEKNLRDAIDDSKINLKRYIKSEVELGLYLQAISLIYEYFFKVPHHTRRVVLGIFALIGIALSSLDKLNILRFGNLYAYVIYILWIIIGEAILTYWRIRKDNAIRCIELALLKQRRNEGN